MDTSNTVDGPEFRKLLGVIEAWVYDGSGYGAGYEAHILALVDYCDSHCQQQLASLAGELNARGKP